MATTARRMIPRNATTEAGGAAGECPWDGLPDELRNRGHRWTPQRNTLVSVLREVRGHVTAAELIERCTSRDPTTTASTVYRTLDLLEEMGLVRHGHGPGGREEYHVLPEQIHGHLYCTGCGATVEIRRDEASTLVEAFAREHGFSVDLSHVTISGRCDGCRD